MPDKQSAPFSHIEVPNERHPTSAARASLSKRLGIVDDDEIQDWERHFADEARLDEFLTVYETSALDDDERYLLMDLILSSTAFADDEMISSKQWQKIEALLTANADLHLRTVWEWADIDPDTGQPDDSYQISPRMQQLLLRLI